MRVIATALYSFLFVILLSGLSGASSFSSIEMANESAEIQKLDNKISATSKITETVETSDKRPAKYPSLHSATHSKFAFKHSRQNSPNWVLIEINEVLYQAFETSHHVVQEILPPIWFYTTKSSHKDKICSWKDGNNLYKAKLTYHA